MASSVMITDENMILQLADKLTEYGERTYLMVATIRLSLSRKAKQAAQADGWPEFTTVLVDIIMPKFFMASSPLFTTDQMKCRNFLLHSINTERTNKTYRAIGPDAFDALIHVLLEREIIHEIGPTLHLFCLKKEWLPRNRFNLPPGYHESTLRSSEVTLLTAEWKYARKGAEDYIKYCMENLLTICIRDDDDQLIGWFIQHTAGSIGMLHVMPAHRRQGIAKYMVINLSKKILQDNIHAYVNITGDNLPSIQLHECCGYRKTSSTSQFLLTFGDGCD